MRRHVRTTHFFTAVLNGASLLTSYIHFLGHEHDLGTVLAGPSGGPGQRLLQADCSGPCDDPTHHHRPYHFSDDCIVCHSQVKDQSAALGPRQ